jgi:hypothetical protein
MLSAQAEGWDGQTIGLTFYLPDLSSDFPEANQVVGGAVEWPTAAGSFSVDLAPTQITITATGEVNLLAYTSPNFAGFRIYDALGSAQSLVTASINGASTVIPATFTYDTDNIFVNFGGQSLAANQSVIIDLNFVPESSTWAAGLVALPIVGMWLRRRSARR